MDMSGMKRLARDQTHSPLEQPRYPPGMTRTRRRSRKPRKLLSCEPCRQSKLRCDRQRPCGACQRRDNVLSCTFDQPDRSTSSPINSSTLQTLRPLQPSARLAEAPTISHPAPSARNVNQGGSTSNSLLAQTQTPPSTHSGWDTVLQRPTVDRDDSLSGLEDLFVPSLFVPAISKEGLLRLLPSAACCDFLISEYFAHLSPLFHVLHGPTFEKQYSAFLQDCSETSFSWLALLFIILSVTLTTMDPRDPTVVGLLSEQADLDNTQATTLKFRSAALTCLAKDRFLVHHDMHTLEALIILIYTVSHNEGVERGWILLGMALNMGLALRCNAPSPELNVIDTERRRRCWAGILMLHTYQAILFRDVDMSFLLNIKATMPTDANDTDIHHDRISSTTSGLTQLSLMRFKLRLFQIATEICSHLSDPAKLDQVSLGRLDAAVAEEQHLWDSALLVNGSPSLLDNASYAHWCILQTYAHQLYLLIHRPFHHPQSSSFFPSSRDRCIKSSAALLDLHYQFCELPRLRNYKWLVNGMTSFNALHGAVALASCLLGMPRDFDATDYWKAFEATVKRIDRLRHRSPVCAKAYPILLHLQSQISAVYRSEPSPSRDVTNSFEEWIDGFDWFNPDSLNINLWDDSWNFAA